MGFKYTLIATLFIAQGFAFNLRAPAKGPCKKPISESAEEIPHELEETMHELDEVRETVSTAVVDAYFKGNDPDVIIDCFRQQKGNYSRLGNKISRMIRQASHEMIEVLGDKSEKYKAKAEVPLKTIAITMKSLPTKMWLHIRDKEFGKALEVMRESRRTVEVNSKILAEILDEMAQEVPEAAEKAEKMAHEIRTTAKSGCKAIGDAFRKCVQEGGPEKPVEDDAEVDAEEEEEEEKDKEAASEQ